MITNDNQQLLKIQLVLNYIELPTGLTAQKVFCSTIKSKGGCSSGSPMNNIQVGLVEHLFLVFASPWAQMSCHSFGVVSVRIGAARRVRFR